jgi:hypothetical protein
MLHKNLADKPTKNNDKEMICLRVLSGGVRKMAARGRRQKGSLL